MKNELRKKYLLVRNNINKKCKKDQIIYEKVINNSFLKNSDTILIYVSKDSEVDTINLINYFLKFKKVAVPKVNDNIIEFFYINSLDDLEEGCFNVLEPITNKKVTDFNNVLCITPGICFNKEGYRIGYGKGYYDRFFSKHKIYAIGLCYQECLINDIFANSYDIKVNEVISD